MIPEQFRKRFLQFQKKKTIMFNQLTCRDQEYWIRNPETTLSSRAAAQASFFVFTEIIDLQLPCRSQKVGVDLLNSTKTSTLY
jgi:hypothetical protein